MRIHFERHDLARYGVAVGATLLALLLSLLIEPLVGHLPRYLFLGAIIVAAWYGGLGPSLLATIFGILLGDFIVIGSPQPGTVVETVGRLLFFTALGLLISSLYAAHERTDRQIKQRLAILESISQLTAALNRPQPVEQLYRLTMDALQSAVGANRVSILLLDNQGGLQFRAWRGLSEDYRAAMKGHSPWTRDTSDLAPVLVPNVEQDRTLDAVRPAVIREGIRALGLFPLARQSQPIGILMVYYDAPHTFPPEQVQAAQTIATQLVLALQRTDAYEQLQASEARFRRIVETAHEGIWEIDANARTVFVNQRMAEMLGYTVDEMLGRPSYDFVFEEDRAAARERLETEKRGIPTRRESRWRHKNGSAVWMLRATSPQLNEAGEYVGSFALFTDITQRKHWEQAIREALERETAARAEAEQNADRLRRLQGVTAALAGALTPTQVSKIIVNELREAIGAAAVGMMLLRQDETTLDFADGIGLASADFANNRVIPLDAGLPIADAVRSGEPLWLESAAALRARYPEVAERLIARGYHSIADIPLRLDRRLLGGLVINFSTERALTPADRALILAIAQQCAQALERTRLYEVERQARVDNARLYQEAQAGVRLREEFLTLASHELKSPLTPLLGYTELLLAHAQRAPLSDLDRRALRIIREQTTRLSKMVELLFDSARVAEGQLEIERGVVNLNALTLDVVNEIRPSLKHHTLDLDLAAEQLFISGDSLRLQQVFRNLIQNAVKYSPRGGPIRVQLELRATDAVFCVSDKGIGIPRAAQSELFQRYYRAPNAKSCGIHGMGIGLYLVREIVTRHGGAVTVESEEGQGATFTVRLPLMMELQPG